MKRLLMALVLLASTDAWSFDYATGGCANGCADGEAWLHTNANEIDTALDTLESAVYVEIDGAEANPFDLQTTGSTADPDVIPVTCLGDGNPIGECLAADTIVLQINPGKVGTAEIGTNGVAAAEIADNAVGSGEIAADAVTASEIAADAVAASEIAANAVGNSEMDDNAIGNAEMADNAVGNAEFAATMTECFTLYGGASTIADTDDIDSIWRAPYGAVISEVWCETNTGTVTADLQIDDGTPADVMGSDLVCDTSGETDNTSLTGTMALGDRLDLEITSVASNPVRLTFCANYTYN